MPPVLGLSTYYELQTVFSDKDTNMKIESSMQHLITNRFQHCWVIGFLKHRSLCTELYSLTVTAKNKSPDSEGLLCSVNCLLFLPLLSLLLTLIPWVLPKLLHITSRMSSVDGPSSLKFHCLYMFIPSSQSGFTGFLHLESLF